MSMNKRSVFAMAERQHYSDYGFDPQLGFFQIMEEAMERNKMLGPQSPDAFQFKLQKPMTTGDEEEQHNRPGAKTKNKKKKLGWWSWGIPSALLFWKKNNNDKHNNNNNNKNNDNSTEKRSPYYCSSPSLYYRSAMSGPLQMERSAPACKPRCNRSCSGPLGGTQRRHRPSLVQ